MTWANWTTFATPVLDWVMSTLTIVLNAVMSHPVTGIPFIVSIIGMIFYIVFRFVGSLGGGSLNQK